MKKIMLVLSAFVLSFNLVHAQKVAVITGDEPGWHKIGETTVDFKNDKDKIIVAGEDKFRAILLKTTDAEFHLENLKVVYENGGDQDVQIRSDFKPGEKSRVIDLQGTDRNLKRVDFVYQSVPNKREEKAHVELWGLK
jgi:hypothetical protein